MQRRNQKVVERAPAPYLTQEQREHVCALGLKIARAADYECAGTVEFLMDRDSGDFFFIEVNPRVQVEHTVTEEVTGIDIVRAQILIAEGATLAEATGKASQAEITLNGHAIQCRITTEDPQNNFIPDYGRITAYRGATGHGIRLDGGTAYSGAVITRYYDSLLEKVTAWAPTPEMAIARLDRALREFRIRGVSTNIAFVENLLKHPTFLDYSYTTKFIDTTPELFHFTAPPRPGDEDPDLHRRHHRQRPPRDRRPADAAGRGAGAEAAGGAARRAAAGHAAAPRGEGRRRPSPTGCWRRSGSSSPTPRCATATRACSPRGCAPTT